MIGILLFAALLIVDIVNCFINIEEVDGVMLFARPIVAFFGALLCGGSFGEALLWAAVWGIVGFAARAMISDRQLEREVSSKSITALQSETEEEEDMEEEESEEEEEEEEIPLPPVTPKQPAEPVYRSDVLEIVDTKLVRCKKCHDYIRIPHGVTVIQKDVFKNHTHLRGVIFPDTLKTIEEGAFANCTHLQQLDLPEGLESIGENCFAHCRSLKQLQLPRSLKTIALHAFASCDTLTSVVFADGCAADVKLFAFIGCTKLQELTIPASVQLESNPILPFFTGFDSRLTVRCYAESSAYFEAMQVNAICVLLDSKPYDTSGDFVIENGILKSYTGKNPHVIIPEGTTAIGSNAFESARHIVRVDIPDSVTTIGARAFTYCDRLHTVHLPNGLRYIPKRAFYWCPKLTSIILPQGITSIDEDAFSGTGLGEVWLPEGLRNLQNGAFGFCSNLHTIHIPVSVSLMEGSLDHSPLVRIVAEPGSAAAQYAAKKNIPLYTPGSVPCMPPVLRSESLPGNIRRTYYETLSQEDKLVYSTLVPALLRMDTQWSIEGIPFEKVHWSTISDALEADYPEIFWVNWKGLSSSACVHNELTKAYAITKDQRDQMQKQIDVVVKSFLASVPSYMGDYEKAKRAFAWIADMVEYDHAGLKEQQANQYDSVTADDLRTIYGAFVKKKVVCVGYALAYSYLLHAMGIECVMRSGGSNLDRLHAWACARLEGDYYHIDVTWGDSYVFSYKYFGMTDEDMYALHQSIDTLDDHIPCNATRCSYFAKEGAYLESADKQYLLRAIRKYAATHNSEEFTFKLPNRLLLEQAEDCLNADNTLQSLAKELGHFWAHITTDTTLNLLTIHF